MHILCLKRPSRRPAEVTANVPVKLLSKATRPTRTHWRIRLQLPDEKENATFTASLCVHLRLRVIVV